ncbi:MAG TPA: serine/threonine-protein kinase [Candidatus Polarisedimenticolia bacterium]|jgi:serine/threonine protein kinase|nr:serine/threonine-protein kinase [Candidatus Polarisedimenticolia bacterium]
MDDERLAHLRAVADLPDLTGTRYRLIRRLGSGGMATVYLVEDTALRREAALKVLSDPDPSGDLAARLVEEARLLAGLEHPNLAPVHDVGTLPDGRVFYVMKYVRGARLDEWIATGPDRPALLRLFIKVCDAVSFAHAHGVVHRDLKPQNIMVGEFGEALVLDWGVTKVLGRLDPPAVGMPVGRRPGTADGSIVGTPAWMAPEQARGDLAAIDSRTDVYALGAILYFLLGRRPPFPPGTGEESLRKVLESDPASLRSIDPSIPRQLQAIAAKAMAKHSADRYPAVGDLSADVLRFLDGLAVEAYPESIFERAGRLFARTRTLAALIAAYTLMRLLILWLTGR